MSERNYEVSFRTGPLDDRQVDDLADTLFELGYDDLCFRPLAEPKSYGRLIAAKFCNDCGDRYINWGAHAERCTGRPAKAVS